MKTIFTLLTSLVFTLTSLAYDGTRMSISSFTLQDLRIEIDGRRYGMGDPSFIIRDLPEGRHTVKIFREKRNSGRGGLFGRKQDMLYNNTVYLRNGYHLDIMINRFGKALVDEQPINARNDGYPDNDERWDDHRNDRHDHDNRWDDSYNRQMSEQQFRQVKESLSREWFETTRLSDAKQIIDRNYLGSEQVKQLGQLFSFENNKLELAKYAYGRTVDKRNYYLVKDIFSFSSSKEELDRYIREYR